MVIADMTLLQLSSVRYQPGVVSIWGNRILRTNTNESRPFIGVPQMRADREIISRNTNNPGFPISGKGVGIGYLDTGIDGTVEDLKYGTKVRQ
jgi:serine protease AprX